MTIKDCYKILQLKKDADLEAVKKAYRKRAFELHPDLHPNKDTAAKEFQELNEAYVILSNFLEPSDDGSTAQAQESKFSEFKEKRKTAEEVRKEKAYNVYKSKEEVIQDILNDPFAKRVFEDIYRESHNKQSAEEETKQAEPEVKKESKKENKKTESKKEHKNQAINIQVESQKDTAKKGLVDNVKTWLKKQVDEEQKIFMPANKLFPGARLRLQIRKGFSEELQTIELSLPADFVLGKAIRLKGMGKKIGSYSGDMYITLLAK